MITRGKLTRTELETLAVMLGSATNHMSTARDKNGDHVWDGPTLHAACSDIFAGFYALQDMTAGPGSWVTVNSRD